MLERPNISYISTVDACVRVRIESLDAEEIKLNAPELGLSARCSLYPDSGSMNASVPDRLSLLKGAVEVAERYAVGMGYRALGLSVTTKNDDAFSTNVSPYGKVTKSGLGSSAAVVVAAVAGVLHAIGAEAGREQVHKLAQIAHSLATGKVGSGFDVAAATYGSIVYTRYSPSIIKALPYGYSNDELVSLVNSVWDYNVETLSMPKRFRLAFANFLGGSNCWAVVMEL